MLRVRTACSSTGQVEFSELFPVDATRAEIVTTFLALLELLKANRVTLRQEEIYAPHRDRRRKGGGDVTLEEQISAAEAVLFASGEPVRIDALLQALEIAPEEFEPVLRRPRPALRRGAGRPPDALRGEPAALHPAAVPRDPGEGAPARAQADAHPGRAGDAGGGGLPPAHHAHGGRADPRRAVRPRHGHARPLGADRERGRRETVGRPILYGTTEKFLQHFALSSLEELPKLMPVETRGTT